MFGIPFTLSSSLQSLRPPAQWRLPPLFLPERFEGCPEQVEAGQNVPFACRLRLFPLGLLLFHLFFYYLLFYYLRSL